MVDENRSLELEVEVVGTPEEVWRAIATGPGISSWYVPHTVEEREGGAAGARFGPGPEMQVPGRVAAWEPPHRVVFDGGEGAGGMAFEWLVEARDGGTCVVRLVNSGFGTGDEWDGQYDAMTEGWGCSCSTSNFTSRTSAGRRRPRRCRRRSGRDRGTRHGPHLTDQLGIAPNSCGRRPHRDQRRRCADAAGTSRMSPRGGSRSWSRSRHRVRRSWPSREPAIRSVSRSGPTSTAPMAPLPRSVTSHDGRSGSPIAECQPRRLSLAPGPLTARRMPDFIYRFSAHRPVASCRADHQDSRMRRRSVVVGM